MTDGGRSCGAGLRAHGRGPGAPLQGGEHARPGLAAEEEPLQGRAGAKMADAREGRTCVVDVNVGVFIRLFDVYLFMFGV